MKIAELKGEKTVQALAKRLAKEAHAKISATELAAALLRLNPHLRQIERLEEGTPILLPPNFDATAPASAPLAAAANDLLQEAGNAVQALREAMKESAGQTSDEIERAQTWLKGEQARLVLREVPELKEHFAKTASAANDARKEQAAFLAGQDKLLKKLQTELTEFLPPPRKAKAVAGAARESRE